MKQIDKSEQLTLARSLLKRGYPNTVKVLGEGLSDEENSWVNKLDTFRHDALVLEINSQKGREKIKYVSKNKLRKIMVAAFAKAYGDRCVKVQIENELAPWFEMKFTGWIVTTRFSFGRRESMIRYHHSILSEAKTPNPELPPELWGTAMTLGHFISFASWLGICSQTQWMSLVEGDVDQACDAVIKHCGHFFDAVPQLSNGLEFEKIILK